MNAGRDKIVPQMVDQTPLCIGVFAQRRVHAAFPLATCTGAGNGFEEFATVACSLVKCLVISLPPVPHRAADVRAIAIRRPARWPVGGRCFTASPVKISAPLCVEPEINGRRPYIVALTATRW